MSSISSPYGLRPINLLGGQNYAGSTRLYSIGSGYATAIQFGDPVVLAAGASGTGGLINRFNATTSATTVTSSATLLGVFVGCTYTDPTLGKTFKQNYTGGIVASDIFAYVVDDPDALFQVQADGAMTRNYQGANAALIQTVAGSSNLNTISGVSVDQSSATSTNTLPIRIVDFVDGPTSAIGDAYTDVIVRINTHFHRTTTGNAIS
jgi:hypothetical protein